MPSGPVQADSQQGQVDYNRESFVLKRPLRNQQCGRGGSSWQMISLLFGELWLVAPSRGMSDKSLTVLMKELALSTPQTPRV